MSSFFRILTPIFISLALVALILGAVLTSLSERTTFVTPTASLFPTLPPPNLTPLGWVASPSISVATTTFLPPTQTACPPPQGWLAYTVQAGDTLDELARQHGIAVQDLLAANCLLSTISIPGTRIFLPPITITPPLPFQFTETGLPTATRCTPPRGWIRYTVKPGDTLTRLSILYRISIGELRRANCIWGDYIQAGQRLYVPNVATSTSSEVQPINPTSTQTPTPSSTPTSPPTPTQLPTLSPSGTFTSTVSSTPTDTETPIPYSTSTPEPILTETTVSP